VGAFFDTNSKGVQAGAVYIFERNQGGVNLWGEVKKCIAADGVEQGLFGFQLDLDKDTLVVSSPGFSGVPNAAYVLERNRGGPSQWGQTKKITLSDISQTADDSLGFVAIDEDTIVLGNDLDDDIARNAGAIYVIGRNVGGVDNWGLIKKITTSDSLEEDRFGSKVAVSGNTIGIGASNHDEGSNVNVGAVYIYE
jgi:hypothetical protein